MPDLGDRLDWLSDVAARTEDQPLFQRDVFITRLCERKSPVEEYLSGRLFTSISVLSSAAAGIVLCLSFSAWPALSDPLVDAINALMEVML